MAQAILGLGLGVTIVALFMGLLFVMAELEKASEPLRQRVQPPAPGPSTASFEARRERPTAAELETARAA